jgi:hypothetical protein
MDREAQDKRAFIHVSHAKRNQGLKRCSIQPCHRELFFDINSLHPILTKTQKHKLFRPALALVQELWTHEGFSSTF